jgi:predicted SprT family Zn-dependent metalloprotease
MRVNRDILTLRNSSKQGSHYTWNCPNCGEECWADRESVDTVLKDGYLASPIQCAWCNERLIFVDSSHPGGRGEA